MFITSVLKSKGHWLKNSVTQFATVFVRLKAVRKVQQAERHFLLASPDKLKYFRTLVFNQILICWFSYTCLSVTFENSDGLCS